MSEQSIFDKSQQIRNEVLSSGNTKERVSEVLDDINSTKANKIDLIDKLSITTETTSAPDDDFKYVYILDEDNVPKRMLAGYLGKNVANAALTSVAGAGLMLGANWEINTSGFYYSITGLNDVSNDSTFNTLLTQNSAGRVAKSNGKGVFMSLPALLTDTQKTTWRTEMNGGWTTATMSVGSILPAVTPFQDAPTWVTLRGANLNLNPANFSITIISNAGSVLATIPNSQVNLINDNELSFYYNFYSLGVGNYKFRLNNGIATYDTWAPLKIADNIIQVPIGSINWGEKSYNDFDSPLQSASGGNVHFKVDANQKPIADENVTLYKVKALDNLVFENSENFYIEMNLTYNDLFSNSPTGVSIILANNPDLNLNDDSLIVLKLRGYGGASGVLDVFGVIKADYANNTNLNIRITKQGDQVTIGYKITQTGFNVSEGVSVTSIVNTSDLHLGFAFGNKNNASAECNVDIVTAYKF